jgi:acetoin utilization deacetylase AcuC-like enzyme
LWISHPACVAHENTPGNPEIPGRVRAIEDRAESSGLFERIAGRIEAPRATRAQLALAHDARYVDQLFACAPASGRVHLDYDTSMMPRTLDAALHAAGAVIAAVDQVLSGGTEAAFCNVRPPGHHAERARAMGFCLFNNVAIGALHALGAGSLERVAVFDFDVHHGNGTEQILGAHPGRALFASLYQCPLYPNQVGARAPGHMVNVPMAPGAGAAELRAAWAATWEPALLAFRPELLLISAGFDAHHDDPLGELDLVAQDYHWLTTRLAALCREVGARGVVSSLEGGYDVDALAASACAHVTALLET